MCTSSAVGSFSEGKKVSDRSVVSREARYPSSLILKGKNILLFGGLCWRVSSGGEGSLGNARECQFLCLQDGSSTCLLHLPEAPPWELVLCTVTVTLRSALEQPSRITSQSVLWQGVPGKAQELLCVLFVLLSRQNTTHSDTGEASHPRSLGNIFSFAYLFVFPHMTRIDIPQAIFRAIFSLIRV